MELSLVRLAMRRKILAVSKLHGHLPPAVGDVVSKDRSLTALHGPSMHDETAQINKREKTKKITKLKPRLIRKFSGAVVHPRTDHTTFQPKLRIHPTNRML